MDHFEISAKTHSNKNLKIKRSSKEKLPNNSSNKTGSHFVYIITITIVVVTSFHAVSPHLGPQNALCRCFTAATYALSKSEQQTIRKIVVEMPTSSSMLRQCATTNNNPSESRCYCEHRRGGISFPAHNEFFNYAIFYLPLSPFLVSLSFAVSVSISPSLWSAACHRPGVVGVQPLHWNGQIPRRESNIRTKYILLKVLRCRNATIFYAKCGYLLAG